MTWLNMFVLLCMLRAGDMINRPVYKVVLTQKGYAQFLQYDIETPPLREFTICTWIRVYDLGHDQSIFTYIANGSSRVARLWLESGGGNIKVSINGRVTSTSTVDIMTDVWRHLCLSYQSDFGAWALYIDARLVSCEAAQSLRGYTLPGDGSVIIGYGTADNGSQNGFEGEIFGVNMILASTIERNYTARNDPLQEQKPFTKNKIKNNYIHRYIVLSDLQTEEIHNNFEKTELPLSLLRNANLNKSYIKFRTPYNYIEHDVGVELIPMRSNVENKQKEALDILVTYKTPSINNDHLNFWSPNNEHSARFKHITGVKKVEPALSSTADLPIISEYETPPPPPSLNQKYTIQKFETNSQPTSPLSIYKIDDDEKITEKNSKSKIYNYKITDIETPPPQQKNTRVYGQWTSSKFAGSVLNYLKSINFHKKEYKKPPPTIPLFKVSDSFPYASDFKLMKVRPPSAFQRKNLIERRYDITKLSPQINVQILQDDLRSNIIKSHAQTRPKQVEIFNRGETTDHQQRFYRSIDQASNENVDSVEATFKPKISSSENKKKNSSEMILYNNNLLSVLSFLKSKKYSNILDDLTNTETKILENSQDMYSKSLSKGNKWHNVKSYNNDYTPRHINMNVKTEIDQHISDSNKNIPSIRLNYKYDNYKLGKVEDENILKARDLATEVSNLSNSNTDTISILKYNHGFLPTQQRKGKIHDKINDVLPSNKQIIKTTNNFNKYIKIGNALNERLVIGVNDEQKKVSFVGGDDTIPDINRYRSEFDNEGANIPASLGPRVCKNVELYDRVLYVQPDESIDMTHILSPIRVKNIGIEFIIQNYKKCSLTESLLEKSDILYINWSKTPVRLFGGAYPRTTTDLCGFF